MQYDSKYRWQLYHGSRKWHCPQCQHKTFVPYVYTNTGEPVDAEQYGRCDREQKCGYHEKPERERGASLNYYTPPPVRAAPLPPSYIDAGLLRASFYNWEQNHFVTWLRSVVGDERAQTAVQMYVVGTTPQTWHNGTGTIFWQIDMQGHVRAGKYMLYNPKTGKRSHERGAMHWAHKYPTELANYHLVQCLFGEHLLRAPEHQHKPVAIVESEKTAILASVYIPQFLWLATGGCGGLKNKRETGALGCLRNRNVVLFPDAGKYTEWQQQAELLQCSRVSVNQWVENNCTPEQYADGWDIADFLQQNPPDGQTTAEPVNVPQIAQKQAAAVPVLHIAPPPEYGTQPPQYWHPFMCYVDADGMCYIPVDSSLQQYAVRSIDAYNHRTMLPHYISVNQMNWHMLRLVEINTQTMQIDTIDRTK